MAIPIVFHHGLFGFRELKLGKLRLSYFHGIDRAVAERGHPVTISRVHPTASIETRAIQLKQHIMETFGNQRVIIVAHSMGGLDARYMIAKLGMEERVAALLTVCTPHRGSPYADWCVRRIGRKLRGFELMKLLKLDVQGIVDLTLERCAKFNEEIPDAPGVGYFSISAAKPRTRVPPFAMHSHKIIYEIEGENDSLVSVQSAAWGTHLATWPVDHFHAVNKRLAIEFKDRMGDVSPLYLAALERVVDAGQRG